MLLFGKLSLRKSFTESFEWMQKLWSTQHSVITLQDRSTSKQGKLVSLLKRHFSKPIALSTVWQDVLSVLLNHRLCAAVRRPLSRKRVIRYGLRGYAESPVEKNQSVLLYMMCKDRIMNLKWTQRDKISDFSCERISII